MHVDLTSRIFLIFIILIGVISAGFAPVYAILKAREGVLIVPTARNVPSWKVRREDDAETYWWYFGVIMIVLVPFTLVPLIPIVLDLHVWLVAVRQPLTTAASLASSGSQASTCRRPPRVHRKVRFGAERPGNRNGEFLEAGGPALSTHCGPSAHLMISRHGRSYTLARRLFRAAGHGQDNRVAGRRSPTKRHTPTRRLDRASHSRSKS